MLGRVGRKNDEGKADSGAAGGGGAAGEGEDEQGGGGWITPLHLAARMKGPARGLGPEGYEDLRMTVCAMLIDEDSRRRKKAGRAPFPAEQGGAFPSLLRIPADAQTCPAKPLRRLWEGSLTPLKLLAFELAARVEEDEELVVPSVPLVLEKSVTLT